MWNQNRVNSVSFVSNDGHLDPYHSSISLFHDHKVALIVLMTGSSAKVIQKLRAKFIEFTMLDPKKTVLCAQPDQFMDPATGYCLQTVLKDSIKPVTEDYATRWKSYEGCKT